MYAKFNRADYDRLPEGFPAELIGGALVKEEAPTYGHQRIENRILTALVALVGVDRALPAPVDVGIDEWNVFQPDIVVLRQLPVDDEARDLGIPLLAVEVLSPSTARRDRGVKCRRMLRAGVAEVWIVDRAVGLVECHDAEGGRTAVGDAPLASRAVPGFILTPATLFSPPK